ncbi:LOW QUALITY PROTEIN: hypothetical protein PHMEG_0008348 [Phytophthora megakarya]|uniref:Uncharacterized protein n=1 Tax=Phytophthora megakarya TaxID=4795 RepID=A0A225WKN3_9STRA|nr:LOW QUALITY PROTEIN: hypothetical protein PHMEG_0008348 [Phytophthora megakarya]
MQGISSLIEQKGVAAGNITKDILETTIQRVLERAGMTTQRISAPQDNNQPRDTNHLHFMTFYLLPKYFAFPRMTSSGAWILWWFGDKYHGFPPLKRIHTHDLPSQALHKSFSDMSVFVRHIAKAAASAGSPVPKDMTDKRAAEVFRTGMENLQLTPSTCKCRLAELSVATIVRLVRETQAISQTTL